MKSLMTLLLLACGALVAPGCYHAVPVKAVEIDEPGVHVVAAAASTSVVWSDGRSYRVCTLGASGAKGGPAHGKFPHPAPSARGDHAGTLDALLFHLCEARGNGDLSPGQYGEALEAVQEMLEKVAKRAHGPLGFEKQVLKFHEGMGPGMMHERGAGHPGMGGMCPFHHGREGCPCAGQHGASEDGAPEPGPPPPGAGPRGPRKPGAPRPPGPPPKQ